MPLWPTQREPLDPTSHRRVPQARPPPPVIHRLLVLRTSSWAVLRLVSEVVLPDGRVSFRQDDIAAVFRVYFSRLYASAQSDTLSDFAADVCQFCGDLPDVPAAMSERWVLDDTATTLRHRNDMAAELMVDGATKDVDAAGAAQGTVDRGHPLQDGPADPAYAGDAAAGHNGPSPPGLHSRGTPLSAGRPSFAGGTSLDQS
ncbi:hypothetical protein HPB47_008615 [Ixodes persulcatus]|uniref:Uncharacterized protein n=1 Tax=Ixodes persulcatus TaxID=34615 RepID=A0AC60P4D3_IXOPE|nr:hypothetical protein HPB47_008615 [Ixodes persulcatus]